MAQHSLILISKDPYFVPTATAIKNACLLMACHADVEGHESEDEINEVVCYYESDTPSIMYTYGAEAPLCPACGQVCEYSNQEDSESDVYWWNDFTHAVSDAKDCAQLNITTPCCHTKVRATTLNFSAANSRYHGHGHYNEVFCGFSRFELWLRHTHSIQAFTKKQIIAFENIFGCELWQILFVDD